MHGGRVSTPDEEIKLHVDHSYDYYRGARTLRDANARALVHVCEPKDGTLSARIVACMSAFEGVETKDVEAIGNVPDAVERTVAVIEAERDQWMKIAALLLHRFALTGETVVITREEIDKLDARYPDGADLHAEDTDDGGVSVALAPPGEEPSRIIVPPHGPGRLVS